MIKISIDFRHATQGEIDAFNAVPGLTAALAAVQSVGHASNTTLTVANPGDQLGEVKDLLLSFMRDHEMKVGHVIPEKPFLFKFLPSLNPAQDALVETALSTLVDDGILTEDGKKLRLTDLGFKHLY